MLHKFAHYNGRLTPLREIRLSPGQSGLLSGWGVFTTMRVYEGLPFAFERHWKRLSADAARIDLTLEYKPEEVLQQIGKLIKANAIKEGCLRTYFVCNTVGHWISDEPLHPTDILVYSADLPERKGPVRLDVQAHGRYASHPLSGVKVTSWLQNVWALQRALRQGFGEVAFLNERNEVAECTAANIFCVRNAQVVTPPLSSGCLPGVTRQVLMEIGSAVGLPIQETPLDAQDLFDADEVFITSTTREVQPVSAVRDSKVRQAHGPVTQRLSEAFSSYVADFLKNFRRPSENRPAKGIRSA